MPDELGIAAIGEESVETDQEAIKALQNHGLAKVSSTTLADLKQIGLRMEGLGVMKLAAGGAMVNQQRLEGMMQILYERAEKKSASVKTLNIIGRTFALLSGKYTESQKMVVSIARGKLVSDNPSDNKEKPLTPSFMPGAVVQINVDKSGGVQVSEKVVANPQAP